MFFCQWTFRAADFRREAEINLLSFIMRLFPRQGRVIHLFIFGLLNLFAIGVVFSVMYPYVCLRTVERLAVGSGAGGKTGMKRR